MERTIFVRSLRTPAQRRLESNFGYERQQLDRNHKTSRWGIALRTCYWVHAQRGFRESEEASFCAFGVELRQVPFKVRDCTDYLNRTLPTRKQMEDIGLIIPTEPKRKYGGFAGMGFVTDSEDEN